MIVSSYEHYVEQHIAGFIVVGYGLIDDSWRWIVDGMEFAEIDGRPHWDCKLGEVDDLDALNSLSQVELIW